jgi:hypothetical protein
MANKKTKTKKPLIGKKRQDVFFLVSGLLLIGFLIFGLYQRVGYKSQAREQDACIAGQVSDQGCAAHGCDAGTRRVCHCVENNKWQCSCTADSACKKPTKNSDKKLQKTNPKTQAWQQNNSAPGKKGLINQLRDCALSTCGGLCQIPAMEGGETIKLSQQCTDCVKTCMEQ